MRRRLVRPLAVALAGMLLVTGVAQADNLDEIEQQLDEVAAQRAVIESRIQDAASEYDRLQTRVAELEAERDELDAEFGELRAELDELDERVSFRVRETFKHGQALDPIAVFLSSDDPNAAFSKADAVNRVVGADQARGEDLTATRTSVAAVEDRLAERVRQLDETQQEQQRLTEQLQSDYDELESLEASLSDQAQAERERIEQERLAREQREREERARQEREERERDEREAAEQEAQAAQEAAEREQREAEERQAQEEADQAAEEESESSGASEGAGGSSEPEDDAGSGGGAEPAPTSGGMACPLDQPRSFIDSWGHARSGGRAHRGTDLMGPLGIPVRAITDGTYNVQSSGPSAGLWAILVGDNGDHYWYMHLDSHTVSDGARVSAGQQVGTNGSTGNASAGAEHVHFELHPGGGSAVNPYSLLRSVCG